MGVFAFCSLPGLFWGASPFAINRTVGLWFHYAFCTGWWNGTYLLRFVRFVCLHWVPPPHTCYTRTYHHDLLYTVSPTTVPRCVCCRYATYACFLLCTCSYTCCTYLTLFLPFCTLHFGYAAHAAPLPCTAACTLPHHLPTCRFRRYPTAHWFLPPLPACCAFCFGLPVATVYILWTLLRFGFVPANSCLPPHHLLYHRLVSYIFVFILPFCIFPFFRHDVFRVRRHLHFIFIFAHLFACAFWGGFQVHFPALLSVSG